MKKHYLRLLIAPLAVVLLAGCGPSSSSSEFVPDLTKASLYRTTFGTDLTTLNSIKTNEQPNSMHIANFIDGLVENDVHGRIVPALAESWSETTLPSGKQEWTFNIRDVDWVDAQGEPVGHKVKADDWVYAAEQALDPENASEVVYLYWMFVDGSEDYFEALEAHQKDESKPAPDFEDVGIKAVSDSVLKFTLPKAMHYFPTVLTYSVFFPISRGFVQDLGGWDHYGVIDTAASAAESIAYNGAFLLESYTKSNSIVYLKNPSYWDKDSVNVDIINMTYVPDDAGPNWARLKFEAGVIDGFRVQALDVNGWEKYVEGPAGTGTDANPYNPSAYVTSGTNYDASYYMSFNYKRPRPLVDTNMTIAEVENLEKALANRHFRRAFMFAVDKGAYLARYTPNSPNDWAGHTYMINALAVDENGKDYVEYVYEKYAEENDITVDAARDLISPGTAGIRSVDLARAEMRLAKPELIAAGVTFPIKAEYWFGANTSITPFQNAVVQSITDAIGTVDGNPILSNSVYTTATSTNAFYYYHYSIQISNFGWGPDFGDPMTYLNTFIKGGDLTPNLGLTDPVLADALLGEYTDMVLAADEKTVLSERFAAFAAAEYKLIFDDALVVPTMKPYAKGNSVSVTKIQPRTVPDTLYGNSADKLKFIVVYNRTLTREEVQYFRDKFLAETEA